MIRRAGLVLFAIGLVPTTIIACGGSGESSGASTVPPVIVLERETITLAADRVDGATVLTADDESLSVTVPDLALPDDFDPSTLTAVVERATAGDAGTVVEFALGPDGTEFDEPVTLTWTGQWDPDGVVGIAAVGDDGTDLLPTAVDSDEVLKTLQVVRNDDGTSTVSIDVDHFSTWSLWNMSGFANLSNDVSKGFLTSAGVYDQSYGEFVVDAYASTKLRDMLARQPGELCLAVASANFGGLEAPARNVGQRKCNESFVELTLPAECPRRATSFDARVRIDLEISFATKGTSPFEFLVLLLGGTEVPNSYSTTAWASASQMSIFMRWPYERRITCEAVVATSTTVDSSTTSTDVATTTTRPVGTGSTTKTTVQVTTTTMATTTTTIKATTTTKPRQGATTTLPRPGTGGTTTLP